MIGLIFGETSFPKEILKKVKKKKKKFLIIDLTKNGIFKREKNCFTVSIGQFGKIINIDEARPWIILGFNDWQKTITIQ